MNATETLADRLADRVSDLAPAERRVADALVELGPDGTLLSASVLAARLGTSDATVVRTAKALGYSGLAELRRALVVDIANPPPGERLRRTLERTRRDQLFATAIGNHLTALDELARNVSTTDFESAVAVLTGAERVVWRGVGPSAHLAAYAQVLTQRVGKPSTVFLHTGTSFADELLALRRNDAVVLLAYGRLQTHVRVLVDRAVELGVPVVLITDTLGRRLGADVHTRLQSGRGAPGLFASHGTTLVLIEALVLGVAANDRTASAASLAFLNDLRAALAGRRIDVDTP